MAYLGPLSRLECQGIGRRSSSPAEYVTASFDRQSLEHAQKCYAHLAGWLGEAITDALQREGYLAPVTGKAFAVTDRGRAWSEQQGIAVPLSSGVAISCLLRIPPFSPASPGHFFASITRAIKMDSSDAYVVSASNRDWVEVGVCVRVLRGVSVRGGNRRVITNF